MRKLVFVSVLMAAFFLGGCATIIRGDEQQVHINAYDAKTNNSIAANCIVSNDEGVFRTPSNRSVVVSRDKDLLTVKCETDTLQGQTIVDGEISGGFVAIDFLFIDLCLISCWVDGLSGSWAEYKTMIDVPMDPKVAVGESISQNIIKN